MSYRQKNNKRVWSFTKKSWASLHWQNLIDHFGMNSTMNKFNLILFYVKSQYLKHSILWKSRCKSFSSLSEQTPCVRFLRSDSERHLSTPSFLTKWFQWIVYLTKYFDLCFLFEVKDEKVEKLLKTSSWKKLTETKKSHSFFSLAQV